VLACVQRAGTADEFSLRRARREVEGLEKSPERSILDRLLLVLESGDPAQARLARSLVSYACELERTRRLPEANAAITLAFALDGTGSATALHAARLARKLGERERALALYCAARELDGGSGAIARLARVGEAVVGTDPVRALGRAIRHALRAADAEAAAVGLEERAAARRAAGDRTGAARDLTIAAIRYTDAVDRARTVDIAAWQLERERRAQQVVRPGRDLGRALDGAEGPSHQPPSTVSSSKTMVSFSVSTLWSPAFMEPISSVFGQQFVIT